MLKVGIGLPTTIVGVSGSLLVEWAKRADAQGFSSLSLIDRIAYPNFEVMTMLGAAAAVTSQIRLMPSVLLAPTRSPGLLAKQAATVDAISGGRVTLGLGIGGRAEDYIATGLTYHDRGRRFEEQLGTMKRLWRGEPFSEEAGPIGPPPARAGGPELLIGAHSPAAITRVGRWADGYVGSRGLSELGEKFRQAEASWQAAGRPGRPRLVSLGNFALGPGAAEIGAANVSAYYSFAPERVPGLVAGIVTTPEQVREYLRRAEEIGADEVSFSATVPDLEQIERLREALPA